MLSMFFLEKLLNKGYALRLHHTHALCGCCRYAEKRMGWVITHVWHLAGQDIEKTCGEITQKVQGAHWRLHLQKISTSNFFLCRTTVF